MTITAEPGIDFWLNFVKAEGGLWDQRDVIVDVVLPPNLQQVLELPEHVRITTDPEAAREEQAQLLIPGHPALHSAATQVLERGDVGVCHLEWPSTANPEGSVMIQRAREHMPVEHGRVDAAEPQGKEVYLPVLRVGALVTYSVSVEETFQEVEEVWIDATTSLELPATLRVRLENAERLPGAVASRPTIAPNLETALSAAHGLIENATKQRREALLIRYRHARTQELARAETYYEAALESIRQRAKSASEERKHLYLAQLEATQVERRRRLQEIEEKHQPSHEIRFFRLHLYCVPALEMPVVIRRGARIYPFSLTYAPAASCFLPVRCPRCSTEQALVASKEGLGCRACIPAKEQPIGSFSTTIKKETKSASETPAAASKPATSGSKPKVSPGPPKARTPDPRRLIRTGGKLADSLWGRVAMGERWKPKDTAPNSPMAALSRLYGLLGPGIAAGLPPGTRVLDCVSKTAIPSGHIPGATTGYVLTDDGPYTYTVRWRIEAGRPLLGEVLPYIEILDETIPPRAALKSHVARRMYLDVAEPRLELGAVEERLWDITLPKYGLPLVVRCLSCWWGVEEDEALQQHWSVMAASLTGVIARRSGIQVTNRDVSLLHDCDPAETAQVGRVLNGLLGRDSVKWF